MMKLSHPLTRNDNSMSLENVPEGPGDDCTTYLQGRQTVESLHFCFILSTMKIKLIYNNNYCLKFQYSVKLQLHVTYKED